MPDSPSDGRTTVWLVPSIANIAAPTTAEISAGVNITSQLTPDGLRGFQPETADVDASSLNSTFSAQQPGRVSLSGTGLMFKKQTGTDTQFNTLVYGYATNVIIRRTTAFATAATTGQKVSVYPVVCGEVQEQDPAPNELEKFMVPMKPASQPNLRAAIA